MSKSMAKCHPDKPNFGRGMCETCYMRDWVNRHKAERDEYLAKYNSEHKDHKRDYDIQYRADNAEKLKQVRREYRIKNKDIINEKSNIWQRNHKESRRKSCKKWSENNPDRVREIAIKSEHKKREIAVSRGVYSIEEWDGVKIKYDHRCLSCGRNDLKITIDHVVPMSKGGTNTIDNIQPLCKSCNCSKGNRRTTDYRQIWNNRLLEIGIGTLYPR